MYQRCDLLWCELNGSKIPQLTEELQQDGPCRGRGGRVEGQAQIGGKQSGPMIHEHLGTLGRDLFRFICEMPQDRFWAQFGHVFVRGFFESLVHLWVPYNRDHVAYITRGSLLWTNSKTEPMDQKHFPEPGTSRNCSRAPRLEL